MSIHLFFKSMLKIHILPALSLSRLLPLFIVFLNSFFHLFIVFFNFFLLLIVVFCSHLLFFLFEIYFSPLIVLSKIIFILQFILSRTIFFPLYFVFAIDFIFLNLLLTFFYIKSRDYYHFLLIWVLRLF